MQVTALNGTLSAAEQDFYVQHVTAKYPVSLVEKITLDVQEEYVDVSYMLHRFRDMRKMGGHCIGDPRDWNPAKQAELRGAIPNSFDL